MLELVPITLTDARRLVTDLHRHNMAPQGWLFGTGVACDGRLVGAVVVGRPVARGLQDGRTVEITRVVTDGTRNANSKLYGAACRMAAAGGYLRAFTYTLEDEGGASLRAAGFTPEATLPERSWVDGRDRYESNLFGERVAPEGPRIRWCRQLLQSTHKEKEDCAA